MTLRARIVDTVKTNTAMINLLKEKAVYCNSAEFSSAINYRTNRNKDRIIRDTVREILEELERK